MATVNVPAQHVEGFRLGAAEEISFDAKILVEQQSKLIAAIGDREDEDAEEVRTQLRYLRGNLAVLEQLNGGEGEDHEVFEDAEVLAHVAESMFRKALGPKLAKEFDVGPIDDEQAADLLPLLDGLKWATETAARCHAEARKELGERLAA